MSLIVESQMVKLTEEFESIPWFFCHLVSSFYISYVHRDVIVHIFLRAFKHRGIWTNKVKVAQREFNLSLRRPLEASLASATKLVNYFRKI